jgi:hypothetical protein
MQSENSSNGIARNPSSLSIRLWSPGILEQRHYASTTINLRLAAVRRLAYEAADSGPLSADQAAGIRRVKGAKRLGVPVGNWLTANRGKRLLLTADGTSLRGKRDYATLAILLGCGLRRAVLTALRVEDIQQREEHWVIADLVGQLAAWKRETRQCPLFLPDSVMGSRDTGRLQGTNPRMRAISNGFQCSWVPFMARFPCSGERHCGHCLHQPRAHYAVLRNTVVHNADRQWLKLASEVARKVSWLLWYR